MADNKNTEEKATQSEKVEKVEQEQAAPKIPASARKPGQNYGTAKFTK